MCPKNSRLQQTIKINYFPVERIQSLYVVRCQLIVRCCFHPLWPAGSSSLHWHVRKPVQTWHCIRRSQVTFGIEHIEIQSGVPRSIMKINAKIPMMFRTSGNPESAPWLAQPRRTRVVFECLVLSPPKDSRSLRYVYRAGTLL